jgi:hypothetical protein
LRTTFKRLPQLRGDQAPVSTHSFGGRGENPSNIPASPHVIYAEEGWVSWGDWLGTGAIATNQRKYLPFTESRDFARSLGLKGAAKWKEFCQRKLLDKGSLPVDVPLNPDTAYANSGWSGWCDWLGPGRARPPKGKYCSFHHARAYVRGLELKSYAEWRALCKGRSPLLPLLPSDIPNAPDRKYLRQGWAGWGDWLGTGNVATRLKTFRRFEEARAFARSLGLENGSEWGEFCKGLLPEKGELPRDIPQSPQRTYAKSGWSGMGDWLGTGRTRVSKPIKHY